MQIISLFLRGETPRTDKIREKGESHSDGHTGRGRHRKNGEAVPGRDQWCLADRRSGLRVGAARKKKPKKGRGDVVRTQQSYLRSYPRGGRLRSLMYGQAGVAKGQDAIRGLQLKVGLGVKGCGGGVVPSFVG